LNSFFERGVVVQDIFAWNKNNIFIPLIETELYYRQNSSGKTLFVHIMIESLHQHIGIPIRAKAMFCFLILMEN